MDELSQPDFERVLTLFHAYLKDPLLYAVIEGRREGRVFVDDPESPGNAFVWARSECAYLAGDQENESFNHAIRQVVLEEIIPEGKALGREFLSLFVFPEPYGERIEKLFADQLPIRTPISTFQFHEQRFLAVEADLGRLSSGYTLGAINAQDLVGQEFNELASDIKLYWGSIEHFIQEGVGYCVRQAGCMLAWCYVQAFGARSQTIDIWTDPAYRRKGLGAVVASAVIRKCLEKGVAPFWFCDEANLPSRKLAQRLGFEYQGDILLVDIPFYAFEFYSGLAKDFFLRNHRYQQAAEFFEKAFRVKDGSGEDYFHAARSWAGAGEEDKTWIYLNKAIAHGWRDVQALKNCPELESLLDSAEGQQWVDKI